MKNETKLLIGLIVGLSSIYLIFGIPSVIYKHFELNGVTELFTASDILQYYGTILGAAATIVAVVMTINYSRKEAEKNKIELINTEYRKIGVNSCLKLIDIFDIQTFDKFEGKQQH